jgi:acetyl-CoA carboxylase biotin carboxyl carrier protein
MAANKKAAGAKGSDKRIRELAKLLEETGLCEIEIEEDGTRIRVATSSRAAAPVAAATAPTAAPVAEAAPPTEETGGAHPGALNSPMVGTVYVCPEPGAQPFVQVGDQVEMGQTVLIVEAMKVMNPIQSPRSGKVIEILVSDAEPVEFGQPLLVIESE